MSSQRVQSTPTILDEIVQHKRRELERLPKGSVSVAELRQALGRRADQRDFLAALRRLPAGEVALIAEVKKASPSAGVIRADFDPVRIAQDYAGAGAACLSVLTDEKFFQGSLQYLKDIRRAVRLPLLRKDFIIDERQLLEAVEWGADAILLIVAILGDAQLAHFHALAVEAGLSVLVEVHDETELQRALGAGAQLVGVNNRDLKTFKVDLGTTERVAAKLFASNQPGARAGEGRLLVAESGIHTRADVERLAQCGARAILVGESLMREGDLKTKVRQLLGRSR